MSSTIVRNWRKAVSVLVVLCLIISLMPVNSIVNAETVTVYHEDFTDGIGNATQSGGASLTAVSNKIFDGNADGTALYIGNRVDGWDAADFKFSDIGLENGKTYTVTIKGYVDSNAVVSPGALIIVQPVNPATSKYGSYLGQATVVTGAAFTITAEYTADADVYDRIRIQSNNEGAKTLFYIGDILITEPVSGGDEEEPERDPALPFTTVSFEDLTKGGFDGRAGSETLTVTAEENHTANGTYALKVEGRSDTWHGPSLRVEKYIDKGKEYKVTAWVKLISPASSQLQLSTQIGNGGTANYISLAAKTISNTDGWVKYEGTYRYNNVSSEYLTIYVESSNNASASFYIDDISFESTGSGPIDIQRDLIPLKDVYQNDFLIGNAVSSEDLEGVRLDLLKMHYNIATAGNAMKPDSLQPSKGNFTFTAADVLVDKVLAEGLKLHGHTLVWHQQSPAWMNTKTENDSTVYLGREEALDNLRTHIKTVVEHFGNKVISWDVVNEAMNDNPPNPSDWEGSLRQSPWYYAIGSDYVEQAFLAAREVLDDHPDWNIKLYYNDYNLDNQNKSQAVYNMVNEINTNYQETHPGELLIDGIGMQGHYTVTTNPSNVQLSLERFISLGVEVSITELDIQTGSNYQLSEKLAEAQGYLYAQLFKIFKAHAANMGRITIWGLDDGTSWRAATNPVLFDKNLQAKPAYYGAVDPDGFMAEHQPTTPEDARQSTANYATPVIDGNIDQAWSSAPEMPIDHYQMAWQGANGTAKTLWDDNNLYILIQVSDSQLDKSSENAWEEDSVEVFVDENNGKTSFYQEDDGQYRVNFDNEGSFNPQGISAGFESAVNVSGTNYTVEMKIPFKTITPDNNKKIGFDAQINDAKDGARQSAATWNDTTSYGYQDTSVFGVITLTGKGGSGSRNNNNNNPGSSVSTDVKLTIDQNSGKAEITVSLPVTVNSDGSTSVNISDTVVDSILKQITELSKTDKQPTVSLKLTSAATVNTATLKLPGDALTKILSTNENALLNITSGLCNVNFDSKSIEAISQAGSGATEITVSKVDVAKLSELSGDEAKKIAGRPAYEFTVVKGGSKVSDFKEGSVTASIPYTPAKDEDPNAVLIYWIDNDNTLNPVGGNFRNGVVEFKTTHFSKFAVGYNKVTFKDVKTADDFYAAATYLGAREVISGNSFEPERTITRGEAIVMLMKSYNLKPLSDLKGNFSDAAGQFAGYYAKAKEIGLTYGVGNNRLGADSPVTHEMFFSMIHNLLNYLEEFPAADSPAEKDTDFSGSGFSGWSVNAVKKLVDAGILKIGDNDEFRPKSYLKKGNFANALYSLVSRQTIN